MGRVMFERFTERSRQVAILAQQAAREYGAEDSKVDAPHILLGLVLEDGGLASRVLISLGITEDEIRYWLTDLYGTRRLDDDYYREHTVTWTAEAKRVFEYSLREALALGHNYIGTEHILLGLVREPNVTDAICNPATVRDETLRMLSGPSTQPPKDKPLTVSFEIIEGQVWVDSDEVAWYVRDIDVDGVTVYLDRTAAIEVNATELVRKWRLAEPGTPAR